MQSTVEPGFLPFVEELTDERRRHVNRFFSGGLHKTWDYQERYLAEHLWSKHNADISIQLARAQYDEHYSPVTSLAAHSRNDTSTKVQS